MSKPRKKTKLDAGQHKSSFGTASNSVSVESDEATMHRPTSTSSETETESRKKEAKASGSEKTVRQETVTILKWKAVH